MLKRLLILLIVPLVACAGSRPIVQGPVYPRELPRARTLDIQVFRHETTIELTNTTEQRFGPVRLWLNGRFARDLPGFDVGQTLELPLDSFRDEFSESFRAGGFFATVKPDRLVLAEIETEGALLSLVVVGETDL